MTFSNSVKIIFAKTGAKQEPSKATVFIYGFLFSSGLSEYNFN